MNSTKIKLYLHFTFEDRGNFCSNNLGTNFHLEARHRVRNSDLRKSVLSSLPSIIQWDYSNKNKLPHNKFSLSFYTDCL